MRYRVSLPLARDMQWAAADALVDTTQFATDAEHRSARWNGEPQAGFWGTAPWRGEPLAVCNPLKHARYAAM